MRVGRRMIVLKSYDSPEHTFFKILWKAHEKFRGPIDKFCSNRQQ